MARCFRGSVGAWLAGWFVLFAVQGSPALWAEEATRSRPNILFFLSDDQRASFVGCAGHPILKTPTMDRLAANGVRFTNMFVTTSICAASRATILTGLYERSHGYTFGTPPIKTRDAEASYPARLRDAGYRTGFVGKFGVSAAVPNSRLFDVFRPLGRSPYFKKQKDGSRRHVSEIAGDRAIEFLRETPADQPFCLSVSFNAPHAEDGDKKDHYPWPKAVDGLYDDVEIPPPELSSPEIFASQPKFLRESMHRDRWYWRWDTPEKYQRNVRAYYRMISGIDGVMGRVLRELESMGRAENTVVVFSGDNGYYKGARGFAGKWSHYEESLRVPLIVFDPRLAPERRGHTHDAMVLNVDLAPTFLDIAGVDRPQAYQGRSVLPLVQGAVRSDWRAEFFCEHLFIHADIPKYEGLRGRRYVYARYFDQEPAFEFLHDLQRDPSQLENFANDPRYESVLEWMRLRCDRRRDELGGAFDPKPILDWRKRRRR